ncbi:MAG: riboflavin biosynthesis protein RibF [Candidatus Krumholzibacteria bacterium]|nr:riboflavin biosynthesis protein RibF [Candidatus Krumholzibacteria bacterium]MDH4336488.1 riboflavin biosynthesis protein RibF [Candidatus Krumholzibacteria bacterium]MDH5269569.1 riboflavin biosynthesis protein RibF [Candidatus Krumholzibacteria bacterium]
MRVARSLEELATQRPVRSGVTLGVFDGVHCGHQRIIEELIARRDLGHVESAWAITFDPHPVLVTHSLAAPALLTTIDERLELLGRMALDGVFVLPFDETTAHMNYRDFIQRYFLDAMDMRELVLGYDCHFGHKREGSPERVMEEGARRGFAVKVVPAVNLEGEVVSSTTIRARLLGSDLERANQLLGHPYLVRGRVVEGEGRGRDLGFPTANLQIADPGKLWPPAGVYAVRVGWRGWIHEGMMNIGRSPTIKRGSRDEIEVHIFDFDNHLYGETLSVYCEAFLRPEHKFPTVSALIEQLAADRNAARERLGGSP